MPNTKPTFGVPKSVPYVEGKLYTWDEVTKATVDARAEGYMAGRASVTTTPPPRPPVNPDAVLDFSGTFPP